MQTLVLTRDDVDAATRIGDVTEAVEQAFAAYERGDAQMPAKSYIDLPQYNGDFRSMPAYLQTDDWDAAAVKWVNVHPDNPVDHDLPTVMGTVIYSDPETAFPLALMDGTELTMKRTGAAAAVATKHLAIDDATTMGIIGAGVQSYSQLEAIAEVRPIETAVVSDLDEGRLERFEAEFGDRFDIHRGSNADAAGCDVLSTVTPVREPIVSRDDLADHTHVNAIGADAEGKQELDTAILQDATLVIDDHEQCTHSGEINVPYNDAEIDDGDIDAEIGEIAAGVKPGRTDDDGITVFDSTGLAIQDVAAAHVVYERATDEGMGTSLDFVGANS